MYWKGHKYILPAFCFILLLSDTIPRSDGLLAAAVEAVTWLPLAMLLFVVPYLVMAILLMFVYYAARDVALAIGAFFFRRDE